jgi:protein gp37
VSTTSIEWATDVWNPFTGCDRVSPGCAHCYAAEQAARIQRFERGRMVKAALEDKPLPMLRYQNDGEPGSSGPGFKFTVQQDKLDSPPRFKPGARVFVNSMSDVFHEDAPDAAVGQLLNHCVLTPDVNWLILTKRPERMLELVRRWYSPAGLAGYGNPTRDLGTVDRPVRNLWLGVSIENRRFVHRADLLRETPAAVRFISAEPLLGPLIAPRVVGGLERTDALGRGALCLWGGGRPMAPELDLTGIDWLIVGAESGAKRRRFDPQWARDLLTACTAELCHRARNDLPGRLNPAFFFKQGSAFKPGQNRELDGRTWDELPSTERSLTHAG